MTTPYRELDQGAMIESLSRDAKRALDRAEFAEAAFDKAKVEHVAALAAAKRGPLWLKLAYAVPVLAIGGAASAEVSHWPTAITAWALAVVALFGAAFTHESQ